MFLCPYFFSVTIGVYSVCDMRYSCYSLEMHTKKRISLSFQTECFHVFGKLYLFFYLLELKHDIAFFFLGLLEMVELRINSRIC